MRDQITHRRAAAAAPLARPLHSADYSGPTGSDCRSLHAAWVDRRGVRKVRRQHLLLGPACCVWEVVGELVGSWVRDGASREYLSFSSLCVRGCIDLEKNDECLESGRLIRDTHGSFLAVPCYFVGVVLCVIIWPAKSRKLSVGCW